MSESAIKSETVPSPQTVYLKDYEVPACLIDEIYLHFDLYDEAAFVTSRLRVRHNRFSVNKNKNLKLNGEDLILESIKINGQELENSAYQVTDEHLIIHHIPENFELEIKTKIFPQKNTKLS